MSKQDSRQLSLFADEQETRVCPPLALPEANTDLDHFDELRRWLVSWLKRRGYPALTAICGETMITTESGDQWWTQHLSDYSYEQVLCMRITVVRDQKAQEALKRYQQLRSWLLEWGQVHDYPGFDFTMTSLFGLLTVCIEPGQDRWEKLTASRDLHWIRSALEHVTNHP